MSALFSIETSAPNASAAPWTRARGLELEWLATNGLGDYASANVLLCPTRRYHGLLVARPEGREKRYVFLSRFEERVTRNGSPAADLSMARFGDVFSPLGDERLRSFESTTHPRWTYALEDDAESNAGRCRIRREVQMVRDARTVLCRYSADGDVEGLELELRPFLPFREADDLTVRNDALDPTVTRVDAGLECEPYAGLPRLHIRCSSAFEYEHAPTWYEGLDLEVERARGFPDREDHFTPGVLRVPLDQPFVIAVSIDGTPGDPVPAWNREEKRRKKALAAARADDSEPSAVRLAFTADDFLVRTPARLGVDAGFPWFTEWGRDTFISLPGLTLGRGRIDVCEEVLTRSIEFLQDGLLPNIFGLSRASSHYGSVDASLWFARAVQLYESEGGDTERIVDEYLPALLEIATSYWDGTGLGVRADDGGLIQAGDDTLNPTWMDARTPAGPVTPRSGCAVEINALWYSLLQHVEGLCESTGERKQARTWKARRRTAKRTFLERFWLEGDARLADLWSDGEVDARVRPNMVIAAALEHSPLTRKQRAGTVARAKSELLTTRGLRTLAANDPAYRGRYEGGPVERDGAYHQGTVWPWLFGFYVEATLRGVGTTRTVRDELEATWNEIVLELDRAGIHHVSEVFDGDAPHRPNGTIAQAWNTAELLRARRMLRRGHA